MQLSIAIIDDARNNNSNNDNSNDIKWRKGNCSSSCIPAVFSKE